MNKTIKIIIAVVFAATTITGYSQEINFFTPKDQKGINKFEPGKYDTVPFDGLKVKIGGAFTQQYQSLNHSNTATPIRDTIGTTPYNLNELYHLSPGFNLASANLFIDVQLEDGIRLALEGYMSSRHHSEFWVKGGYIQIDKLPMFGNPEWFSKYVSLKVGHFGINYGDQQFRRSDNGFTLRNPFVENLIMDGFATEIGAEIYVYPTNSFFLMAGLTSGLLNGDVREARGPDNAVIRKNPSILAKAGFDKQISDDLRFRLTGSLYANPGTTRNTLYAGDRSGSRYFLVAEPDGTISNGVFTATSASTNFTSGRINPGFTHKVTSVMINPFVKAGGLEFFGTLEFASGVEGATRVNPNPATRNFTQMEGELIYRFLPREQLYVGARYNTLTGRLQNYTDDISVDRTALALGWFATKNILMKLEYVNQKYKDFIATDYRNGLEFNGVMIEAAVGF